jgi:hypothetical protein
MEEISLLLSGIGSKKHFTLYVENDPQIGSNGGLRGTFAI